MWIVQGTVRVILFMVPILCPLPDVAEHIIQSPGIRLELSYWVGLATCIGLIPGIVAQLAASVPKAIGGERSSACRIFPLSLRWQTVWHIFLCLIELLDKLLHCPPRDAFHRSIRVPSEIARIV